MTRRTFRMIFLTLFAALALVVAPAAAMAQDDSSDLPVYPGPFDGSGDQADDSTDTDGADNTPADEVLGVSVGALVAAEGDLFEGTSIDNVGADEATSFVAPDVQPSASAGAAGVAQGAATTTGGLANTGTEVEPIVAVSVGLMAVGGAVLVSSRRSLREIFA